MASTLLVALDGSELAETSLPWATALARTRGLSLGLVQVLPSPPAVAVSPLGGSYATPALYDQVLSSQREAAIEYLTAVRRRLASEGLDVEITVRQGEPARTLLDLADERGAYAVALATHGRGGLTRMLLGSVAEGVLQHATVPVLLVRAGIGRPSHAPALGRLLIPLDGSPLAERALDVARQIATERATLVLARVVAPVWHMASVDEGSTLIPDEAATRRSVVEAEAYLRPLAQEPGPSARAVVSIGDAADEILAAAKKHAADLIVMSTHGRTGPRRWILGSVADRVVRHSDRPVLLVSARAAAGATDPGSEGVSAPDAGHR